MSSAPRLTRGASGLRVICETMPAARSVALGLWIGVGSRFEHRAESGVSHFLEHLLFKGTPDHSAREIAELFDGLGGEINAATSRDYTVVYARVLDEHVETAMGVLCAMVQSPTMADLDREREVVLEEIAMYEDEPQDVVHDLAVRAVFPDQALGRPVIGRAEVVASVPVGDLQQYHRSHYRAPNIVLAAAGGISGDRLEALAERYLDRLPSEGDAAVVEPGRAQAPRLLLREKDTEQYHVCISGPGVSRDDPRRHAQAVLDTVVGGSMSSRLFQEIRERRGLAYSVGSYTMGFADTGLLGIYLGTRGDNLTEAVDIAGRELERVADEGIPDEELARVKEHIKGRVVLGLESPGTRMNRLGRTVLSETELLSVDELLQRIEAVDAARVRELAADLWQPRHLSVSAIGPSSETIEAALQSRFGHLAAAQIGDEG